MRQSRAYRCLPGRILAAAGRQHLAQYHLGDSLGRHAAALEQRIVPGAIATERQRALWFSPEQADQVVQPILDGRVWMQVLGGVANMKSDIKGVFSGSVPYLKMAGIVLCGWQMARAALIAQKRLDEGAGDARFYQAKIATARFFADHILSGAGGLRSAIVEGSAGVLALDVEPTRLRNVRATLDRLGLGATAALRVADATDVGAWWDGRPFDAILLDAPCSATGVVRRQPDILLHRREADIVELTRVQARLLDKLWPTLAPGGVLLYATCSILRAENDRQVAAFVARTPDANVEPLDARFGRAMTDIDGDRGHQRLPGEDGMDGFFYARLRKRG